MPILIEENLSHFRIIGHRISLKNIYEKKFSFKLKADLCMLFSKALPREERCATSKV